MSAVSNTFGSNSDSFEKSPKPSLHRCLRSRSLCLSCSFVALAVKVLSVQKPFFTQRNRPPAAYWVKEYRDSPGWIQVLECRITAEGIRMVEPGGKSMTRPRSHKMRCPPRRGSKGPRDVMEHHPKARLPGSVWEKVTVNGPKLMVAAGQGPLEKLRRRPEFELKSFPSSAV